MLANYNQIPPEIAIHATTRGGVIQNLLFQVL